MERRVVMLDTFDAAVTVTESGNKPSRAEPRSGCITAQTAAFYLKMEAHPGKTSAVRANHRDG